MVTVEYHVDPTQVRQFFEAMTELENERRRDGAFAWGLFQDAAVPERVLEYFIEDSWLEHLRHHARVTQSDRDLQARIRRFHVGTEPPRVSHYLANHDSAPAHGKIANAAEINL